MRYLLFCHSISRRLVPYAAWLKSRPGNEIMLASSESWQNFDLPGVKRVHLKNPAIRKQPEGPMDYWEKAVNAGKKALQTLESLRASGWEPDIILNTSISGSALGLLQAFPKAFLVHYVEPMGHINAASADFHALLQDVHIRQAKLAFSFENYPGLSRAPLAVDCDFFVANDKPRGPHLVLGFFDSGLLSSMLKLAQMRQDLKITMILPNNYIKKRLQIDFPENICLAVNPPMAQLREILASASLYIQPGGSRKIPLELLMAMSCEAPVMTNCPNPFFRPGENCLKLNRRQNILEFLDDKRLGQIGARGRADVLATFSIPAALPAHFAAIHEAYEKARANA